MDLCQRLFRSFQNSEAAQEDSASEIIRRILTRLSASTLLCSAALINYRRRRGLLGVRWLYRRPPREALCCADMAVGMLTRPSRSPTEEVFLKDVSCYFSLLEDGQPRDKLECEGSRSLLAGNSTFPTVMAALSLRCVSSLCLSSCFQALRQRRQRSARQLCKFLSIV